MGRWLRVVPDDADAVAAAVDRLEGELAEWAAARGREVDAELVAHLVQMRARYGGDGELDVWDGDVLLALLVGIAPAKTVFDDDERAAVVPGMAALVDFLSERGLLADDSEEPGELHQTLAELAEPFAEAATDPSRRSPATALAYMMRDDGVDLTDEQAVGEWLAAFNASSQQERDAVVGPVSGSGGAQAVVAGPPADMPSVLAGVAEDEATLAGHAVATPMLRGVRALVDHLGPQGRELDENATLARADAQAVGELAGAGVGGDVLELALDAGFVRVRSGWAVPIKKYRPVLADRPLQAWREVVEALLDQGVISGTAPEDPPPYAEWFDEAALELLLGLWGAGQPVALSVVADSAVDDVRDLYGLGGPAGPVPADFERRLAEHVALLAERLAFAGLVELRRPDPASEWRVPSERLSETTIAITPLAKQLLEPLAEVHGFKVAPVGELADLDAAALLAELASWAGDIAEAELDAWIAARGDVAAGAELAAVLPEADALTRQRGLAALWSVGAAAEPSVRALAEHAELRPHAIAWLIDRGLASPEDLSADEAVGGVIDVLAASLTAGSCGDDLAEVLLSGLGDRDHALAQIAELWRIDTPHTATVLEALGDAHDPAVAKAARTALFKHRSQG